MPTLGLTMDVHDRGRVQAITRIQYECPLGRGAAMMREKSHIRAGELLRRLVYHLDRFQADLLPALELPPFAGDRRKFCVLVSETEREVWRGLAAARSWSMAELARALVFYHWQLREDYRMSGPALRWADRMNRPEYLNFQPDRLQPWYFHAMEARDKVEGRSLEDQAHLVELLRSRSVSEDVIAEVVQALEEARSFRAGYKWDRVAMSPAELREMEHRSEAGQ